MVEGLSQPLNIFLLGLGGGFLIPLLYRFGKQLPGIAFVISLGGMTVISAICLLSVLSGGGAIDSYTAGAMPPYSINLRLGPWEGVFAFSVNIIAVLGAWHLWERLRASYAVLLLYLILVMGINGMIMTRDLFNLFVFLEIVSIATYGLLGTERTPAALSAGFKYIMATVLASSFFLVGSVLLYHVTGTLNIDQMIEQRAAITGPIGMAALMFVLSCLIVELKPFPANGWGLDVYETAPAGVAALVSVGVSAGVFFALFKLLPIFEQQLGVIALSAGLTFVFSNLVGLRQSKVQRMLGYSSIAQMALAVLALALLTELGAEASLPLVVGGIFLNHLFAKAGLFWLAGIINRQQIRDWGAVAARPSVLFAFAVLLIAISGLPPFPSFWAKWELVMQLAEGRLYFWIGVLLVGSLFEVTYMFRWFRQAIRGESREGGFTPALSRMLPVYICVGILAASGYYAATRAGAASIWLFAPLYIGGFLCLFERLPARARCALMLLAVLLVGIWMGRDVDGISQLFAALLLPGGLVVASAGLYRVDPRPGYYPLMAVLLLAIVCLLGASTSLEFFFCWELITLSSYFLISMRREARGHALRFLIFSLASAFLLLAGFGIATAANGTVALAAFEIAGPDAAAAFALLAIGLLIKAGAVGVHVWLPGTYAEADDDLSAMLSAVVSKVAMFGLFMVTYIAIRSELGLDLAYVMGWIGVLTTVAGALMALQQDDVKRMLAYSSMSQIGYIVTAIALMSHLGWVTALYLVANHLMVKGILFLAVAGIILRAGTRRLDACGGLARNMPFTFAAAVIALISMSGLPPLAGFGGKWLLLSAMMDRGWYGLVALGVLATLIGLLYMFRLGYSVFLGPARPTHQEVREAPAALLVPQFLLVTAILVLSFFPKLFMEPISAAIDPQFASTLVWEGMSLELIYGTWNPVPVMAVSVAIAAVGLGLMWFLYRVGRVGSAAPGVTRFYGFYKPVFAPILTPYAYAFWRGISGLVANAAGLVARIYGGNGQVYALYVLYYVAAIYFLGTVFAPEISSF
ncbi:proton-conducting membrane transporter [Rhizobiaceae bacterium n13]|uniref:Proton-conducting membrane transporter n=1 Tax=Ferirhizobium litorale TaxID=2927786 RepID=A0AAE3U1V2_9HYPH|nr:proton-conducting transporter membrane subunit [Fererhizobium litorale]MDI7861626.1 proton-conducting membrane transporter [Fererhizobium litorale]MDI7922032.1 proton-conducting membrane transporter [Fererhizobium litorale]